MNLASLAEKNLAEYGEYERLVFEGKTFTNRALHDASCRLARALLDLGCREGDKVVLMMANGPEVFVDLPGGLARGVDGRPGALSARRSRAHVHRRELAGEGRRDLARGLPEGRGGPARPRGATFASIVTGAASPPPGCLSFDDLVARTPPLAEIAPRETAATSRRSSTRAARRASRRGSSRRTRTSSRTRMNGWNSATTRDRNEMVAARPAARAHVRPQRPRVRLPLRHPRHPHALVRPGGRARAHRASQGHVHGGGAHDVRAHDDAREREPLRHVEREALAGRRGADADAAAPRVRGEVRRHDVRRLRAERSQPQRRRRARGTPAQARLHRSAPRGRPGEDRRRRGARAAARADRRDLRQGRQHQPRLLREPRRRRPRLSATDGCSPETWATSTRTATSSSSSARRTSSSAAG